MLTQLKNGDWVELVDVKMIEVCEMYEGFGVFMPPRISVTFRTGHIKMIDCESIEEVRSYRDELAAMVNAANLTKGLPRWEPTSEELDAITEDIRKAMKSSQEGHVDVVPAPPPKSWHDEKPLC